HTPPPQQAAAPAAPAPSAAPAPAAPAAPGGQNTAQGAAQVRNIWPDILEAVKNRRRFTWILLSQNAQVTGFDGSTLRLGFLNAGARDTFSSSGSEEVLKQALAERFNADWRVDAVVDPSGGGAPPQPGGGRPPVSGGHQAAPGGYQAGPGGYQAAASAPAPAAQPAPAPYEQRPAPPAPQPSAAPARPEPAYDRAPAPDAPRPVAPEDDTAEADDPDLVDSALSGHDLIVRELGATVVEEYTNEQ
ncbi:DNA polymerase III subunit gamma and tau, partial [Streptomyces nitrosporeus]